MGKIEVNFKKLWGLAWSYFSGITAHMGVLPYLSDLRKSFSVFSYSARKSAKFFIT